MQDDEFTTRSSAGIVVGVASGIIAVGLAATWSLTQGSSGRGAAPDIGDVHQTDDSAPRTEPTPTEVSDPPASEGPRGALPESTAFLEYDPVPAIAIGLDAIAVRGKRERWRRAVELEQGRLPPDAGTSGRIDPLTAELQLTRAEFGRTADAADSSPPAKTKRRPPTRTRGATYALLVERTTPLPLVRRVVATAAALDITQFDVVALPVGADDDRNTGTETAPFNLDAALPDARVVEFGAIPKRRSPDDGNRTPLNLTIEIRAAGFALGTSGALLPASDACPWDGPTVCLSDTSSDPDDRFRQARRAALEGEPTRSERLLEAAIDAYDFAELYARVIALESEYPNASRFWLAGASDIPIQLALRVADALRWKLAPQHGASDDSFWSRVEDAANRPPLVARPKIAPTSSR